MRTMIDQAIPFSYDEEWADECFTTNAEKSGDTASLCDITDAIFAQSNRFSETGTCDYFLTEDRILAFNNALAFQVRTSISTKTVDCLSVMNIFPERKPVLGRCKQFDSPGKANGPY